MAWRKVNWKSTPEMEKKAGAAKDKAWAAFLSRFPKADRSKFVAEAYWDDKMNATAEVFFKEGPDSLQSVFGSDSKYWSGEMKQALGQRSGGGFPYQLMPLPKAAPLALPAEPFGSKVTSLEKIFNGKLKIYPTPDEYFEVKFREIFVKTKLRHTTAKESRKWLAGPHMGYWPQQLKGAGCRVRYSTAG